MSSDDETKELIARAKGDTEACRQLAYWTRRLIEAQHARRRLLDLPPAELLAVMEHQP